MTEMWTSSIRNPYGHCIGWVNLQNAVRLKLDAQRRRRANRPRLRQTRSRISAEVHVIPADAAAIAAHAAFDPLAEKPRRAETLAAHFLTSAAIGPSQSASNVCEGPIAVMTSAIDPA